MILRTYYLLALLWAVLIVVCCLSDHIPMLAAHWSFALGPLAVPVGLRLACRWIMHGPDMFRLRTIRKP